MLTWASTTYGATISADQWVNVAEPADPLLDNLQNIPADAHTKGMWSDTADWPLVSVHALLMPNGKVLTYGTDAQGSFDGRYFDEWDPSKGLTAADSHLTRFSHGYQNSFCSAAAYLPQGKLLISGGDTQRTSMLYTTDVTAEEEPLAFAGNGANMSFDRWYATMLTLPDGKPIIMGGMVPYKETMAVEIENALNNGWASMTPEVYDPETNTWSSLLGATSRIAFGPDYNRTSYPRAWVAPNGQVFGVSADKMWYMDTSGDGSVTDAGTFKGPYSLQDPVNVGSTNTAVMYDIGKILVTGGNGRVWFDLLPASDKATTIDINGASPVLTEQPAMTYKRRFANATVLPTGEVVVLGGTETAYKDDGAVYAAEIWSPNSQSWKLGADASVFRGYHSNATLLPNGTLLSHGGGFPDPAPGLSAQVYYPPYLFKQENGSSSLATRPVIKAISGLSYEANDPIQLDMDNDDTVTGLTLIGVSNGTHAFNAGQRRIPLSFTQDGIRLSANLPNYNLTPPGYYQVVAINQSGVPSKGIIISIGNGLETPSIPTTPYTPPEISNLQISSAKTGEQVTYSIEPASGVTYSWNFGDGSASTAYSADTAVNHHFSEPGVYVVTLSANDNNVISTRLYLQAILPDTAATTLQPTASNQVAYETVANGDNRVWAVNPDNDTVSVISAASNTLIKNIAVGKQPSSIAIAPDGSIWVSNKQSATISIIDASTLAIAETINLDHASQPHGLAFSPGLNQAFVVLEAKGTLIKFDTSNKTESGRVDLGKHIRHVSVNHNTTQVFVSRFITPPLPGESTANVDTSTGGGEVLVINPSTMSVSKTIKLKHSDKADTQIQGAGVPNYLGAAVISPNNTRAWVPSKQDNIKRGTLRSSFELNFQNTVRAISSTINIANLAEDYSQRVDHDNSSLATAAVYHPDGVYAFVTLETSREVAVLDAINGFELFKFDTGRAPQGLMISPDGKTLYIKDFMDRRVSVFDLTPLVDHGRMSVINRSVVYTVSLNQEKLDPSVLLGKQLFYDAKDPRLAKDRYMSCASCHDDGGHDGRVWDMTGFGEGVRNTIALKGKAGIGHGFLHWSSNFDEVQDFEGQIRALSGGTGLMSDTQFNAGTRNQPLGDSKAGISTELDELAAYVSSLNTFDLTPYGNANQTLSTNAVAGKAIFERENCMSCHATPNKRTNSLNASTLSDIGTIKTDSGKRLHNTMTGIDVPTLRNLWETAPYLHDGSALTIAAAIEQHNNVTLTANDQLSLVQYLLEIDNDSTLPAEAPTVSISSPADNATFLVGQSIQVSAIATDSDGTVSLVKLFNGGTLVGTETQAPYEYTINNAEAGTYTLTAVATDNNGLESTSSPISVIVEAAETTNEPPSVAITSPSNNTAFTEGESVTLQVDTGDTDGQVVSVTYYQGTEVIASVTEQPFDYKLTNLAAGDYALTAKALDDDGSESQSTLVTFTVNAPIVINNQPPSISITTPSPNTTVEAGSNITIAASAVDNDGSVVRVSFYDGDTLLGTASTSPYQFTINNLSNTAHQFSAVALDGGGLEAKSQIVSINVTNTQVVTDPVVPEPVEEVPDPEPEETTENKDEQIEEITNTPKFSRLNQNGEMEDVTPTKYTGPVSFLEYQMLGDEKNDVVIGSEANDFINLLGGSDAANGGAGQDVLDGGTGSNFLTGGSGNDTFFIDGRGGKTTWSTITDLSQGDTVNLWGYVEGTSQLLKIDPLNGAEGYKGITYHYDLNNDGLIETSVTFTGKNNNSNITTEAKTVNGSSPYLLFYIIENSTIRKANSLSSQAIKTETASQTTVTHNKVPPAEAIECAKEYEYCNLPDGQTATVWYGAKGGKYIRSTQSGRFKCSAETFDAEDPNIGLIEHCSYQAHGNQ